MQITISPLATYTIHAFFAFIGIMSILALVIRNAKPMFERNPFGALLSIACILMVLMEAGIYSFALFKVP